MKFLELAIIIAIAWYALDPKRMPKITRSIGDAVKGFKAELKGPKNGHEDQPSQSKQKLIIRDVTDSSARAEGFLEKNKDSRPSEGT